ncbi:Cuticle protein 76 [Blattella germanica]|nr:Cuticle protein 76 [Blattella germanica]
MHELFVILALAVATANAGLIGAPALGYGAAPLAYGAPALTTPAITSQSSNVLRSFGNLGQVSTYSKTIDTPYSSVRKYDTRVSNDALAYPAAPALAYHAAPALGAPAFAPRAIAAPALAGGLLGVAYSAAPAVAHMTYSNGLGIAYAY